MELSNRMYLMSLGRIIDELDPRDHAADDVLERLFGIDIDPYLSEDDL